MSSFNDIERDQNVYIYLKHWVILYNEAELFSLPYHKF